MDVITYIKQQIVNVRSQIDATVEDLTEEVFNWLPPGTINPISAILIHVVSGEDFFIQSVLQGKPMYWETQEWGQKIGVKAPPRPEQSWDEFRTTKIMVAPVRAYEKVNRAATDTYLSNLTVDELDRQVNFVGDVIPAAEVLTSLVVHIANHSGEIAAIKGMQGIRGLPY